MSYILEAIKKADQKRKLGTVPDVHTVHEVPSPEPRRIGRLYGLAFFLFLNAAVLGWWLWPSTSEKEASVKQPPGKPVVAQAERKTQPASPAQPDKIVQSKNSAVSAPASILPAQPMTAPKPQPVEQPTIAQAEVTKPSSISPPPSVPAGKAGAAAVGGEVKAAPPKAATPTPVQVAAPAPVVPVFKADTSEASPEEANPEYEEPIDSGEEEYAVEEDEEADVGSTAGEEMAPIASSPSPKDTAEKVVKEGEDPELAGIPFLRQLPPDIQQTIPELHISFHSYSIKPASRLVSISGKILREGQDFDENVKLETITVKGVIMVVNDRRFRMEVQ